MENAIISIAKIEEEYYICLTDMSEFVLTGILHLNLAQHLVRLF